MSILNPTGTSGIDKIYWRDLKAALLDLGASCKGLTGAGHSETYELRGHSLRTAHDKDNQAVGGGQLAKLLGYIEDAGVPRLLLLALLDRRGAIWYGGSPPDEVAAMSAVLAAHDWRWLSDPSRWGYYLRRYELPTNPEPKEPEEVYVQDIKTREYLEQQAKEKTSFELGEVIATINDAPLFIGKMRTILISMAGRKAGVAKELLDQGHLVIEGEPGQRSYLLDEVGFLRIGEYAQSYYHNTWLPKQGAKQVSITQDQKTLERKVREQELARAKATATAEKLLPKLPKEEKMPQAITEEAAGEQAPLTELPGRRPAGLPQALLALCRHFNLDPVFVEGTLALDLEATVLALGEAVRG